MKVNRAERDALRLLVARIEALTAVGDESLCALSDDAKAQVRAYVDSWISPLAVYLLIRADDEQPARVRTHALHRLEDSTRPGDPRVRPYVDEALAAAVPSYLRTST